MFRRATGFLRRDGGTRAGDESHAYGSVRKQPRGIGFGCSWLLSLASLVKAVSRHKRFGFCGGSAASSATIFGNIRSIRVSVSTAAVIRSRRSLRADSAANPRAPVTEVLRWLQRAPRARSCLGSGALGRSEAAPTARFRWPRYCVQLAAASSGTIVIRSNINRSLLRRGVTQGSAAGKLPQTCSSKRGEGVEERAQRGCGRAGSISGGRPARRNTGLPLRPRAAGTKRARAAGGWPQHRHQRPASIATYGSPGLAAGWYAGSTDGWRAGERALNIRGGATD